MAKIPINRIGRIKTTPSNRNKPKRAVQEQEVELREGEKLGKIVLLNSQGWGFIAPETGDVDIFFHYADLVDASFDKLRHNNRVCYVEGQNEKGAIAREIRVIGW